MGIMKINYTSQQSKPNDKGYIPESFLLAFDFCQFCVAIPFCHNDRWPPTSKDFYTRSYSLHYFLSLILEKEPVFPFSMLSAKQGNYWYYFYHFFGMTRSLTGDWTRGPPALEASTLPLGYRGGGMSLLKTNYVLELIACTSPRF